MKDANLILLEETAVASAEVNTAPALDLGCCGDAAIQTCLNIAATEGFAGGEKIVFKLITADNADMTNPATLATWEVAAAGLTKDFAICQRLPFGLKRYLRLCAIPSGTFTAGKVKAFVTYGPELLPS